MPQGVEHTGADRQAARQTAREDSIDAARRYEHRWARGLLPVLLILVRIPLMPQGVEHGGGTGHQGQCLPA